MNLVHIRHQEIDRQRWDQLVRQSRGATLYARSWYLDAVCPGWEAVASPDYSVVMPLTARNRFGIRYLYQPLLSQQLGVISRDALKPWQVDQAIKAIPAAYRLIEITLNDRNPPGNKFPVKRHTTLRLNLNKPYEQLAKKFSENTRRNLRKAMDENLRFRTNITLEEFIGLLKEDKSQGATILLNSKNIDSLKRLVPAILNHNAGMICGIKNRNGRLIAAALMGQDKTFHYYLAPALNQEGRDARAMFLLIDRYIHLHASQPLILDFEGSDIESVARFYKGYGAEPSFYSSLRINRLPWPLNLWADRRIRKDS